MLIGSGDIWPGFTDALSGILLVLIFLITIFVVTGQMLSNNLSGRDATIMKLNEQISQLESMLGTKSKETVRLRAALLLNKQRMESLQTELASLRDREKELETQKSTLEAQKNVLETQKSTLETQKNVLETQKSTLETQKNTLTTEIERKTSESEELLRRVTAMKNELANLNRLIEESRVRQARIEQEKAQLKSQAATLSQRLNLLLAERVKLLNTYRSDFFGKMREVIGENNPDIRIIGDRFILQSEVLFPSGAADLSRKGKRQLLRITKLLKKLSQHIPKDIPWVIQVSGHTDDVPIRTANFPSNWELSSARALNVVRFLVDAGHFPPSHLSATGYGKFHPLVKGISEKARRQNRRIELKITAP